MRESSRSYQIGQDLLVKLILGEKGDQVHSVIFKDHESGENVNVLAEDIDRISKLINIVNDSVAKKYRSIKVCVDHGYHLDYNCPKCVEESPDPIPIVHNENK